MPCDGEVARWRTCKKECREFEVMHDISDQRTPSIFLHRGSQGLEVPQNNFAKKTHQQPAAQQINYWREPRFSVPAREGAPAAAASPAVLPGEGASAPCVFRE
jgi:hypothetical protein